MKAEDLVSQRATWVAGDKSDNVVISSRVRLARNLADKVFPHRAAEEVRSGIWNDLRSLVAGLRCMSPCMSYEMSDLSWSERHLLSERHLISQDLCEKGKGSGVVLREDEKISVMINEEDHLRIQSILPGLDLAGAWKAADALDSELSEKVTYAFSKKFGYLTVCPSNVGTGLRLSVLLHLPGLCLMEELDPTIRGLTRIGLLVRGLMGEGTDASGNICQISNQRTMGDSEATLLEKTQNVLSEVIEHEKNARLRLLQTRKTQLLDYVGRSYGALQHARLISSTEIIDLLSGLRLGCDCGLVKGLPEAVLSELMLLTQPGHLQIMRKKDLSPEERDFARAGIVQSRLKKLRLVLNG